MAVAGAEADALEEGAHVDGRELRTGDATQHVVRCVAPSGWAATQLIRKGSSDGAAESPRSPGEDRSPS
jgi:hypothetical protein